MKQRLRRQALSLLLLPLLDLPPRRRSDGCGESALAAADPLPSSSPPPRERRSFLCCRLVRQEESQANDRERERESDARATCLLLLLSSQPLCFLSLFFS